MKQLTQTQKIQADFRTALDFNTIKSSSIHISGEPINEPFLRSIGMTNSKTYHREKIKAEAVKSAIEANTALENLLKIEASHPQYRIISLSKVISLMKKYNLCIGQLSDYISVIPQSNIEELKKYEEEVSPKVRASYHSIESLLDGKLSRHQESTYFIVAPREFFSEQLVNVNGFLIRADKPKFALKMGSPGHVPDPIVLNPLNITGPDRFFHIPTAWDIEADDELVTTKINLPTGDN